MFNSGSNLPASQTLQGVHNHGSDKGVGRYSNKILSAQFESVCNVYIFVATFSLGGSGLGGSGVGMDLQGDTGNSNVSMDKAAMKRGVQTSPNGKSNGKSRSIIRIEQDYWILFKDY
jgi:CCR4-NOT transcription complex subunit 2